MFDTSVFVSAALSGEGGYVNGFLLQEQETITPYKIFVSPAILYETQEKLEGKFSMPRPAVVKFLDDVLRVVEIVHPTQKLNVVRDPDDNKIIECAVEAHADVIISFDKDLLDIKTYEGIQFVHPSMLKYWFRVKD